MRGIKELITGRTKEVREARAREITYLRHELKNSIQVVQSGNRLLQNMSGVIALNQRPKGRTPN